MLLVSQLHNAQYSGTCTGTCMVCIVKYASSASLLFLVFFLLKVNLAYKHEKRFTMYMYVHVQEKMYSMYMVWSVIPAYMYMYEHNFYSTLVALCLTVLSS